MLTVLAKGQKPHQRCYLKTHYKFMKVILNFRNNYITEGRIVDK